MSFKLIDRKPRPRRLGVVTAVCNSCNTPNGVRLGLQYCAQTAVYQCCNSECRRYNRVTVDSHPVHLHPECLGSAQQGVKVGGVEPS